MEELKKLSKKELIRKCCAYIANSKKQRLNIQHKIGQIRHFRIRLKKIRGSIDYLLQHPFSMDTSIMGPMHKRDISHNQPSKLDKKHNLGDD